MSFVFSKNSDTYLLSECEYDAEDKDCIDDEEFMTAVKQHGEEQMYNRLSDVNSVQYQLMLAGFGYKITGAEDNLLVQLLIRNFLSREMESKIVRNSKDRSLKDYLLSRENLGRITTAIKI